MNLFLLMTAVLIPHGNQIEVISQSDPRVKGIRFLKNYGKSQALHAGF